jgi:hypothetical protein
MFTKRQVEVLRAILSYAGANVDDINDAFSKLDDEGDPVEGQLEVNGEPMYVIRDDELEQIWKLLQG